MAALLFSACSHSGSGARTTPATESIKGQRIGPAQLVDAGNTTPEAALESDFWAAANGNYDADVASYVPQMRNEVMRWDGDKKRYATEMRGKYARFKGLQIVARKTIADDRVELKYTFEFDRPETVVTNHFFKIVSMAKMDGAWRIAVTTSYATNWDEGSVSEPQS